MRRTGQRLVIARDCDDSIEHEARNAGPAERVVLLFKIWRPEIDEADRTALSKVFASINAYE